MAAYAPRPTVRNNLLNLLPESVYANLMQSLETIYLPAGKVLYESGEPIKFVYFPLNCVISLSTTMASGATLEAGMVGCEGILGACVALGAATMPGQATILVPNYALRLRAEILRLECKRGGLLQDLLLRYMNALFVQVSQTAACNHIHSMEGRLCRWLLLVHDRLQTDTLPVTQEIVAGLLGTHRPYITVAIGSLSKAGLLRCQRGSITILDRAGLEAHCCECYPILQKEFALLQAAPGRTSYITPPPTVRPPTSRHLPLR